MSSKQVIEKTLDFSHMESVSINDDLCVLIPDGFRVVDYSAFPDYADSMVIVPKNLQQEADPSDAELALIIQIAPIPCGMIYNPKKESMYTELFTTYYPVFTDEKAVNMLVADKGRGILCQFSSGTDPVAWCKYHGIIFAKANAYFFHLVSSQRENTSSISLEPEFRNRAKEWSEMILLREEYIRAIEHQQKEAEERRVHEAELVRQQKKEEENKSRYYNLLHQLQEQERIVSENRGWFGIQAKRRKAAQMCIREIKAKLASEYPAGLARKHTD